MRLEKLLLFVPLTLPCLTARAQGGAGNPPSTLVGTWRGTSICRPVGTPPCHDEIAAYHFRVDSTAAADSAGTEHLVWQANKVVNGAEEEMGTSTCTYERRSGVLTCPMRDWRWVFRAASASPGDSLVGTLKNPAGVVWRDIRITRTSREP
jgi:hypothetical protein